MEPSIYKHNRDRPDHFEQNMLFLVKTRILKLSIVIEAEAT